MPIVLFAVDPRSAFATPLELRGIICGRFTTQGFKAKPGLQLRTLSALVRDWNRQDPRASALCYRPHAPKLFNLENLMDYSTVSSCIILAALSPTPWRNPAHHPI